MNVNQRLFIILISTLGIGLAIKPYTSRINPVLLKGATWLFRGILSRLLK